MQSLEEEEEKKRRKEFLPSTMWDVKYIEAARTHSFHQGFTFNYVGCKALYSPLRRIFTSFYLNYVGCKEKKESDKNLVAFRFTLTMWDVKNAIIADLLERCGFYLNYVGCKDGV